MRRTPPPIATLAVAVITWVSPHPLAGATPAQIEISQVEPIVFENPGRVNVQVDNPVDGSVIVGGHVAPRAAGCNAGVQAFFAKQTSAGALICGGYAHGGSSCEGVGSDGPSLFEGLDAFDPAFIVSSTQTDVVVDPLDGTTYSAYNVLLAWTDTEGDLAATWGALVLHHDVGCGRLADLYFGVLPHGTPLDRAVVSCDTLCQALTVEYDQYAIETLALDHGALAVGGWFRPPALDGALAHKDLFVALVESDLSSARWTSTPSYSGDDVATDVAISVVHDVFATGYFGIDRDFFVARFGAGTGALTHAAIATGAMDEQGTEIAIEADPDHVYVIHADGFLTDEADFGGQIASGNGLTPFSATYTYFLDTLLDLQTSDGQGEGDDPTPPTCTPHHQPYQTPFAQPIPLPVHGGQTATRASGPSAVEQQGIDPLADVKDNQPVGISLVEGNPGSGFCAEDLLDQVTDSDDDHMRLVTHNLDPQEAKVVSRYTFKLTDEAFTPRHVRVEFNTSYCAQLIVRLEGGFLDAPHIMPAVELCPLDDQILTAEIPPDVVTAIGYTAANVADAPPLEVEVEIKLLGDAPCEASPGVLCSSSGKDCELDEVEIGSDY